MDAPAISRKTLIPLGLVITVCSVLWASGRKTAFLEARIDEHDKAIAMESERVDKIESDRLKRIEVNQRTLAEIQTDVKWIVKVMEKKGYR